MSRFAPNQRSGIPAVSGCYGFFSADKCLYIGLSTNIRGRVAQHTKYKYCDVEVWPTPEPEPLERKLIWDLNPTDNITRYISGNEHPSPQRPRTGKEVFRQTISLPPEDRALFLDLVERAENAGIYTVPLSAVARAALRMMAKLSDAELVNALLDIVKPGRKV